MAAHEPEQIDHHRCRGSTKGHDIGQRVQLLADRTGNMEQACCKAVEKIKYCSEHDEAHGVVERLVAGGPHCQTSAEQIATGQGVGNVTFHKRIG